MLLVLVIQWYVCCRCKAFFLNEFLQVPKGRARIRVQVSAAHSKADLQRCIDAFADVGRDLKVLS